ncbi:MAG: hypothetical protein P0116_12695 [Candidatus Nitrosocosmicus sp.]|nr:hypothetical protein [Candidatus Nitrosocosmicus sp.]
MNTILPTMLEIIMGAIMAVSKCVDPDVDTILGLIQETTSEESQKSK